jgi:hypothetical protein
LDVDDGKASQCVANSQLPSRCIVRKCVIFVIPRQFEIVPPSGSEAPDVNFQLFSKQHIAKQ